MRRLLLALLAGSYLGALAASPARADRDVFAESTTQASPPNPTLDLEGPYEVRSWEPRLGVPTMLWTGARPRPPGWAVTPAGAALYFVQAAAPLYRLDPADLEHVRVQAVHDRGEGVIVVSLRGEVDGIPVLRDGMNVALDQRFRLLGITGYVSPHLAEMSAPAARYELAPDDAMEIALSELAGGTRRDFAPAGRRDGWWHFVAPSPELGGRAATVRLGDPSRVRRVLYGHVDRLEPAYHVEVSAESPDMSAMVAYAISARDGRVLSERNLVDQHPFTYRVFVDGTGHPLDSPNGDDEIPDFSADPAAPPRVWVTPQTITQAHGSISTADPWMTQGSTVTAGNNVDAYADLASPDGYSPGDFRAETTSLDTFDWTFDPERDASADDVQRKAAIVHAFYVANWLHDEFYDSGFDEASGNAQDDNYGRGGVPGDDMRVEVQDYSGLNNANMATPADGGRPRMQMYLWSGRERVSLRVLAPSALATDYPSEDASFGPRDFDVEANLAVATDTGGANALDACDPPLASNVSGNIALIERGNCTFAEKARNAQDAGAVGVIIYDNGFAPSPPSLGGSDSAVTIGVISTTRSVGLDLDNELDAGPVRVRIHRDPSVQTDSAVDSLVVAHEWGHYVSNRLIGNAFGLSGNQARGMGEGWSDFHGLLVTVRENDASRIRNSNFDGTYAGATSYVATSGPYFGIRRVPYSTDFTKNALTLRHIQAGEPLPSVDTAFGSDGSRNTRVHQTGEVWATMLWEAYSALLDDPRLTFDEAYERMKDYLIAGYKLTPVNPTFIEARDALLLAAFARDPVDFERMYAAFARRGAGIGAEAPDRFSTSQIPVVESFATGALVDLARRDVDDARVWCDREGVLDSGETGSVYVDLSNIGSTSLDDPTIVLRSLTPGLTFPDGATREFAALAPFSGTTATVTVRLEGLTEPTLAQIGVDVSDANLAFGLVQTATVGFRVHADEVPAFTRLDDVEAEQSVWSRSASSSFAQGFERIEDTPVSHWWFGATESFPAEAALTSPALPVPAGANLTVTFRHRYDIEETWDGAVVEVSRDGVAWEDASVYAAVGYPVTLRSSTPNPLQGREAFSGTNPSSPGWDVVSLDFGTAFSGGDFHLRFRVGTDWAVSGPGWEIDDIEIAGIATTPFAAVVADRGICVNRPPVARAGFDAVVAERTEVQLDGSSSSDPDGDQLAERWTQVEGPSVATTSTTGAFVAPEVARDTMLTFSLRVQDDEFVSEPDFVSVLVKNVNRAPLAPVISGPTGAVERTLTTLTATATDPDGDAIVRYRWETIDALGATITSTAAQLEFIAPEVTRTSTLTLRVAASDGLAFGPWSEYAVQVRSENRLPTVPEVQPKTATEGEWVSLVARADDPDGDPITYTFRPLDGDLDLPEQIRGSARFRFVAPQVDGDRDVRFSVTADDGFGEGPALEVPVSVLDVPEPEPKPNADAGVADVGGGAVAARAEEGCGCTAAGDGAAASPWLGLGLVSMLVLRRRKLA